MQYQSPLLLNLLMAKIVADVTRSSEYKIWTNMWKSKKIFCPDFFETLLMYQLIFLTKKTFSKEDTAAKQKVTTVTVIITNSRIYKM